MVRVLAISGPLPVPGRPGSLAPVARQIESLRRAGSEVDVLEITGPARIKYLVAIRALRARVARYDLVHAHFGFSGWVGLAQRLRPVVVSFMGSDLLGSRSAAGRSRVGGRLAARINRHVAPRADAVIVKSREMASLLPGVEAHVVPNGVDLEEFQPRDRAEARRRAGWPAQAGVVLFAGCPDFGTKGFDLTKQAFERARARTEAALELRILWGVAPETVPWMIAAADVLVLSSYQEGSPNVVKEALACETPVVSTAVGDVPELLGSVTGCHVVPRDPEAFAAAIAAAIRGGRLSTGRAILTSRGLEMGQVARRVLAVFEDVLERRRNAT